MRRGSHAAVVTDSNGRAAQVALTLSSCEGRADVTRASNGDRNRTIALAGILATGAVGLAAAGVTLITSRDDRESARQLARQALIYDKRSQIYVDSLLALQALSTNARLRRYESIPAGWLEFQAQQAPLKARITAFGSRDARMLYNTMYFAGSTFVAEALAADIRHASETEKQQFWLANASIKKFDKALRTFEAVVQEEVG